MRIFHGTNAVNKGFPWYFDYLLDDDRLDDMQDWGFNIMRWGPLVKDRHYEIGKGLLVKDRRYVIGPGLQVKDRRYMIGPGSKLRIDDTR